MLNTHRLLLLSACLLVAPGLYAQESGSKASTQPDTASKSKAPDSDAAQSAADKTKFIRLTRDDHKRVQTLETAIVRYVKYGPQQPRKAVDPRVNQQDEQGDTPLHGAAANGHIDVVKVLLEKGADPNVSNKAGRTPLHLAAEGGHKEIVEMLLAAGPQPEVVVDLIGAVHIGDKAYYQALNKEFQQYDVLLYELVAKQGTRIPKGGGKRSGNPLAYMQKGMGDLLELDYQLTNIDYQQKNFVHADMSPEEFSKSMEKLGESFLEMFLRSMAQGMAQPNSGPSDAELMMAMFSSNRALALKRIMAKQFEDLEGQMDFLGGPEGSTIITERNKRALEVLTKELDAGKKHIGIFYGAGHMPDMEQRLLKQFGLVRTSTRWLVAWDLTTKKKAPAKTGEEAAPESKSK